MKCKDEGYGCVHALLFPSKKEVCLPWTEEDKRILDEVKEKVGL